jgi:hypothetical protein
VIGVVQEPRIITLNRVVFAFQGLGMTGNKVNKCYSSFSGMELWSALTNRLTPIQRTANVLNSFARSWIPAPGKARVDQKVELPADRYDCRKRTA